MPRLRNEKTGVVVSVSDGTAARLGIEWLSADSVAQPRGNASRESWAAFALSQGVEVPDDATRDEIKAAVGS